jgi:hypothetical protein
MSLRFLKIPKFVVEKEVLFGHGALNLNPIPPNLIGFDAIATQLDSQDTLNDSQVAGYGIGLLDSVFEEAISTQLDSRFSQMDSQVVRDGVSVDVPNERSSYFSSVEFTQSQHFVEGSVAPRTVEDDFIDGEYAYGVDDESEG